MTEERHGKRRRTHPARWRARRSGPAAAGRRGDDEGLIVDWLGVQATGGGGASNVGVGWILALTAIRAAPYLLGRLLRPRRTGAKPGSLEDRR